MTPQEYQSYEVEAAISRALVAWLAMNVDGALNVAGGPGTRSRLQGAAEHGGASVAERGLGAVGGGILGFQWCALFCCFSS